MRTSLSDIQQAEAWLQNSLPHQESLLFEARLLSSPRLRLEVQLLTKTFSLLKVFHRKKLKEEVQKVHEQLFSDQAEQDFQQQIYQLFNQKNL